MEKAIRELKGLLGRRKRDSHKGDYGRVFILAGSRGMTGAAMLTAFAVMRAGAGAAVLGIPASLNAIVECALKEVITLPLAETREGTFSLKARQKILKAALKSDVAVIGPGISTNRQTRELIRSLILSLEKPTVLDADGINAVSEKTPLLKKMRPPYIITPHPGEMARLIGKDSNFVKNNRLVVAKKFSKAYNAVVVLKGYRTVVAFSDRLYVNTTGNPGMSTAGSGDVLTGLIGGFLAQGMGAFDAARLGVYIHGLAGDLAADEKGEVSLIAGDILDKVPEAIKSATGN